MPMEERRVGPVIVLDATGKLTLGDGDVLLRDRVHSLVQQGHTGVVLNLGGVPSRDSAGIGEIVDLYDAHAGGTLRC